MVDKKKKETYVNIILNQDENKILIAGKEKSGIRGSADFVRFLMAQYVANNDTN